MMQVVDFVSNLSLRRGLPSFQHVDARIHVKLECLEHWFRVVATFPEDIHAWSVGLAFATCSILYSHWVFP